MGIAGVYIPSAYFARKDCGLHIDAGDAMAGCEVFWSEFNECWAIYNGAGGKRQMFYISRMEGVIDCLEIIGDLYYHFQSVGV